MTTGFAGSHDSIYSVTLAYCFAGSYNGIGSYRTLVKFPQYRRICSRERIQRKKTDITRKAMSVCCFYGSGLYHRFFCSHNPEQSNSAKKFFSTGENLCVLLVFDDFRIGSVLLDTLDTVEAAGLRFVALRYGNHFPVGRLQAETVLAGLVGINLKLRMLDSLIPLNRLILNSTDAVLTNAFNSVQAAFLRGINLGGGDHLAVSGTKVKLDAGFGLFYNKLAHVIIHPSSFVP